MSDPMNTATITPEPPAAPPQAPPLLPATVPQQDCALTFNSKAGLEALQRAGKLFSMSPLVPKEYQGPDGLPSCCIAIDLANRIGANPLMVMQNLYIVHNRPGWSAKFLIATFNQCGRFTPIKYRFSGTRGQDDWGCRAISCDKATGELIEGPEVTISIAKAEGWFSKSGSKWQTMPEQMLRYRSASWMINTTAPELSMGLPTSDEVEDITEPIPAKATVVTAAPGTPEVKAELLPPAAAGPAQPPAAAQGTPAASGRLSRLRQPAPAAEASQSAQPAATQAPAAVVQNGDDKIRRDPVGQAVATPLVDENEAQMPWPEDN